MTSGISSPYLAVEKRVSAATQRLAFNALLFLYRNILNREIEGLETVVPSKIPRRLPVVLTAEEIRAILEQLSGTHRLIATLIYGAGLRLRECLNLRVKDLDFSRSCLVIHSGKGDKDRETVLPGPVDRTSSGSTCTKLRILHNRDRRRAIAGVQVPGALERKSPQAGKEWIWFWVFPSAKLSVDPTANVVRRHHLYPTTLQKAFSEAVASLGDLQARDDPHAAAQLRHPPGGAGLRHPDRAGAARSCRPVDHHDLHACRQEEQARGDQPLGSDVDSAQDNRRDSHARGKPQAASRTARLELRILGSPQGPPEQTPLGLLGST